MRLDELARQVGAEVVGDASLEVSGVSTLEDARAGQISFLANAKYAGQLETTQASAVIVAPSMACERVALLKSSDPYYAFAQAVVMLHGHRRHPHGGVHPKAHVEASASVGEGTVVYPGAYIGPRVKVGRDCIIYPSVVIYDDCSIGDRVILHGGAVIGQDGFGYSMHQGRHYKIPQIGNVVIEDDVEIGACSCVARAALGSTVIGKGTKIDSQVMIGHGASIGPNGMVVAQVGIAGSTRIGHGATIAGQVGIAGHLKIGDNVTIGAQTGVISDVPDQSTLVGSPAMPASHARRVYALFTQLPTLMQRFRQLEEQVAELAGEEGM